MVVDRIVFVVRNLSVSNDLGFENVFVIGFSVLSTPSENLCVYQAACTNTV